MIFLDHRKEFFIKAAMHAKQMKMTKLNNIEAELMVAEDLTYKLSTMGIDQQKINLFHDEIGKMRLVIKDKKLGFV